MLFAESLDQLNKALELRRERLSNLGSGLPAVLWAVVLAGAVINVIEPVLVLQIPPGRGANRQRIANLFPPAHRLGFVASNRQRIA